MSIDLDEKMTFRLDNGLLMRLDQSAQSEDMSKSELVRELIKKHLEEQDEEFLRENLLERALELSDFDRDYLEQQSNAYLSGVIQMSEELNEKYGEDSREDTGQSKKRYIADKQKKLQTKYQENFDLATKVIDNARQLKEDGVIPQDLDTSDEVQVKRWLLTHKKELNDSKIRRLG